MTSEEHKTMWTNAVLYSCVHYVSQVTKKKHFHCGLLKWKTLSYKEAVGETLQICVCFTRMCFSFSFIFAKKNKMPVHLGGLFCFGNIASPVSPVSLSSPPIFFFCSMHCINMRHQFWHTSPLPQVGRDMEVHLWDSMLLKYIFMCCALYIPMS